VPFDIPNLVRKLELINAVCSLLFEYFKNVSF